METTDEKPQVMMFVAHDVFGGVHLVVVPDTLSATRVDALLRAIGIHATKISEITPWRILGQYIGVAELTFPDQN